MITKDPDTGTQNMGTYRAGLKSSNRLVVRMATRVGGAEGYMHWKTHKARGEKLPCASLSAVHPMSPLWGHRNCRSEWKNWRLPADWQASQ